MALVERYVDPSATGLGTGLSWADAYTSLNAWEAAEGTDLVTATNTHTVHCRTSGSTSDTLQTIITGWTCNATYFITIVVDAADRHQNVWDTQYYHLSVSNDALINYEDYTKIYGLQVEEVSPGSRGPVTLRGTGPELAYCITRNNSSGTTSGSVAALSSGGAPKIYNNVFINRAASGKGFSDFASSTGSGALLYNNTFIGNGSTDTAIDTKTGQASPATFINNLFYDWGTVGSGDVHSNTDYNTTDSASMGYNTAGANDLTSQTFTFVSVGTNYALTSADTGGQDNGTIDPGSGLYSDDILGVSRTGQGSSWDCGAFEVVAGGGGISLLDIERATLRGSSRGIMRGI